MEDITWLLVVESTATLLQFTAAVVWEVVEYYVS